MVDRKVVEGMDIPAELFKKKFAKRRRMSYKKGAKDKRTKVNYERLMSDTCDMGKFIPGTGDYRYFHLIQDEGSRYKWRYPIKKKSDSNANTMMLIKKLIAQGHRIKTFTSDNGGEFINNELISFLNVHGIELDMLTALWPGVLQYIVEIDNMSATRALNGRTPFEKLHGIKPDLNKVRVCGAIGFVYVAKRKNKLSSKAEPALLLGVSRTVLGYRLLHLRTGKIVEACDVQFREDVTVGKKYLSALLVGRHNSSITFQFAAEEGVYEGASRTVVNSLPDSVTSSYRKLVDVDETPSSKGETWSSSNESERKMEQLN
ncbi:Uncharacterized protein PHPALM_31112 [Phytophthora palmivora]|uniref:Integrase catalytic domain-containing protein n=1 Tax=Phytophthora palmivora TaxID=4796 RepID=A0A2P4X3E5_9STRA|nr:Uncharacterized protein PHPALM_31112 [Phytophthora palmivora]